VSSLDAVPDLSMFRDEQRELGKDPDAIGDEFIRDVIEPALKEHKRSLQTEIGPSELGVPCKRWLAHKFAGTPPVGIQEVKWAAAVGTAIHDHLNLWCHAYNERHGVSRYLFDVPVYVGDLYPGRPITGHVDVFDVWRGAILDGKGLAVSTPIPTPSGWTTIGELSIGDQVFGADGQPCTVTAKSPVHYELPCYRVMFDDGTSVISDNVHLWELEADRNGSGARHRVILSTEEAIGKIFNPVTKQRHLRVRNAEALNLPEASLPVHPYVLGAWLGDGDRTGGRICKPDDELFDNIRTCGYDVSPPDPTRGVVRNVRGLVTELRKTGLIWTEPRNDGSGKDKYLGVKQIPKIYLRASAEQRLMLLRGLMDTDGTWNKKRNQAVFNSTDKALAHDVAELVRSLGWKANVFEGSATGFGKTVTAYTVPFVPYDMNPFWLPRKAELVRMAGSSRARKRIVRSIESVPYQPTQCIVVDSPDSMFLCGEDMIPTHNCPGKTQMDKYRPLAAEENPQYSDQVHAYGNGIVNAGLRVVIVGILRLPRASNRLRDAYWKWEPHDPARGQRALARAGAIAQTVGALGSAAIPLMPTTEHFCNTCDYFLPGATNLERACPGTETVAARAERVPAHIAALMG